MVYSVRNIITDINAHLAGVFPGSKLYGVATLVEREGRSQPSVNEQPVGYDDSYSLQIYHRLGNVTIETLTTAGYGNSTQTTNTYSVSAYVFNNEKITQLKTDEVALIIQSVLSANDSATLNGIILNSQQIFATEYRGTPYALDEYKSLMQINYTVEIELNGRCLNICPEDFAPCAVTN